MMSISDQNSSPKTFGTSPKTSQSNSHSRQTPRSYKKSIQREMILSLIALSSWSITMFHNFAQANWLTVQAHLLLTLELFYLAYCLYDSCYKKRLTYWSWLTLLLSLLTGGFYLNFWLGNGLGFLVIFIVVTSSKPKQIYQGQPLTGTVPLLKDHIQNELDKEM